MSKANRKAVFRLALAGLACMMLSAPGWPAPRDYGHGRWHHGGEWHHRDYGAREWRGGHWEHGWHGSHFGWWWIVGPTWFYYDVPMYPYPVYPYPPVYSAPPAPPSGPPPAQYWYYCRDPAGYYPYVSQCPGGWQAVPAEPPQPAQ